ncbi:porphobilinogen deaminase [Legionella geestiana]|uniref:Porphobilinogen deaminase n=1 Tax=Legionella geestiana TaxID=45065 RepID=A0A0W0TLH2_9GAMM|nr:hydroxymethylbilane synthase [Legionella geestiana]KTC96463.1 porphobilinogen deaminase [Legionella geestiana]QBS12506.1 hydroxymethylbilane synthase [Legionella geestiana]QDQ39781.1 hydroxymethylbilane synthase [Legionella geestiana]STX55050.1 porphobilinogen deaminase [Legionella geestiana]
MPKTTLTIATRQSPLALWQAEHARARLLACHPKLSVNLLPMRTQGDKFLQDTLVAVGGKGLFVKELEEALLDGRADVAVHSMKDMPAHLPDGLMLGGVSERANPLDALISPKYRTLAALPVGARVGTASLRRQSQLLRVRPDLHIECLRGNLQTRLAKLESGAFDAIVLACAGLERLGLEAHITEVFSPDVLLPACGQGVLGFELRADDAAVHALLSPLFDAQTARCIEVERRVNAALGGSCRTPMGIYCHTTDKDLLTLRVRVLAANGGEMLEAHAVGKEADALADAVVADLHARGVTRLLPS